MEYKDKSKEELIYELQNLKDEYNSLQATLEGDDAERQKLNFILRERLKELNCHTRITEILNDTKLSVDEICEKIVLIIPEAFQFSEVAEASIVVYNKTFKTPGFKNSKHSLKGHLVVDGKTQGYIEICYPDKQLPETDTLFLPEEIDLLTTITSRLRALFERKQKEIALFESEEEYRDLVENISDVVYRVDLNGIIKYISPSVKKILGFTPQEVVGRNFLDFVGGSPEYLKERFKLLGEAKDIENEYTIRNNAGETHWIRLSTRAIFENDRFVGATGTLIDITEKKLIQMELQKSEEIFRNLVERINDIIYEISMDGTIRYISPAIKNLLGYNPEEIIGKNFLDFVYEPDRKILIDRLMMDDQKNHPFVEYRYMNRVGDICWVHTTTVSLEEDGKVIGKTGTIIDITEKKQAEEQLKFQNERMTSILNAMPDFVFIIDKKGTYLEFYADKVDELITPNNRLIGTNMRDVFDKKTLKLHLLKINECIQKKQLITYDYKLKVNGILKYYEVRLLLLSDDKVFRFVRDITERKNAENQIKDLNANLENKIKERTVELAKINVDLLSEIEERKRVEEDLSKARLDAEEANQAKSEFLSRMSHELRTPMNSILGFAQLLDLGDLNPFQKKSVKHILRSGKILLDLINEVLDISRIEAGKLSLSLEPVQISSLIFEMMDIVSPLANQRKVQIEFVDSPINQLYMRSDRQRLKQVLINLLTNSIKYNKTGGKITIKSDLMPGQNKKASCIRVSVTDTGLGILPENLKKIFNPFERLGAEKSGTEGTGLGLAVVKKLVEAMGGQIGVNSVEGAGSTFWFELPKSESQLESIDNEALLNKSSMNSLKKGTILYVEDNISNIELIEQILYIQRSGIRLITSQTGKNTISLAKGNSPDLILMDLNLPDIHGSEVLSLLQADEQTSKIPVVVISADAMPNQLERLMKAGAKKYLTKPLDLTDLLKVIDEYIY